MSDLLWNGADVNAKNEQGWSPFHFACFFGQERILRILIDKTKGDAFAEDNRGLTPLHYAPSHDHDQIARILKDEAESVAGHPNDGAKAKDGSEIRSCGASKFCHKTIPRVCVV